MRARRGALVLALLAALGVGALLLLPGASAEIPGVTTRESVVSGTLDGDADGESSHASISADGRFVAFESQATNLVPGVDIPPETSQVYRRDRETAEVELISVDANGLPFTDGASRPSISADGTRVAFEGVSDKLAAEPDGFVEVGNLVFISNADGGDDVFIAAPDATGPVNLTNAPGAVHTDPVLSPDGTRIAFARADTADGRFNVYTMNADGSSDPVLLTDAGADNTASYRHPDWSPDGSRLALSASGLDPDEGPTDAILVVNADGSGLEHLTGITEFPVAEAGHTDPAWSPDGTQVAFSALRFVGTEFEERILALVDVPGGDEWEVSFPLSAGEPTSPRQPRWSPSERDVLVVTAVPRPFVVESLPALASVAEASEDDELFRVTLEEGSGGVIEGFAQRLTSDGGFDAAWRRDGQSVVFSSLRPTDTTADLFEVAAHAAAEEEDDLVRLTTNPAGPEGRTEEPHVGPTFRSSETRLHATATLGAAAGQPSPTGLVQFRLCPPSLVFAGECGPFAGRPLGPPVELTEAEDGDGTATSIATSDAVPPALFDEPGEWCVGFEYRGDERYHALQHSTGERLCVEVTHDVADGALEMDVAAWEGEEELTATLTLEGVSEPPSGLVTFFLCGPGEVDAAGCPEGGTQVGPPALLATIGSGTSVAHSDPDEAPVPSDPGRYCWRAEYAGDWSHQPRLVYDNGASCFTFDGTIDLPPHPVLSLAASPTASVFSSTTSDVEVTLAFDEARGEPDAGLTVDVFLCGPAESDRYGCRDGGTTLATGLDISDGSAQVTDVAITGAGTYCYRALYREDGVAVMAHTDVFAGCVTVLAPPFLTDLPISDVFVRDVPAGTTTTVSVSTVGGPADGESDMASISPEGGHVAFSSMATNVVEPGVLEGYENEGRHVFLRDLAAGTTELVSVYVPCEESGCWAGDNYEPSVSDGGTHVAFTAAFSDVLDAVNPVSGEPYPGQSMPEVFVRDLAAGVTELVSVDAAGDPPAPPPGEFASTQGSSEPSISGDGTRIAFTSDVDTLVADDTNDVTDVFVRDRAAGATTRVSVSSLAEEGDLPSFEPAISDDGRTVAFASAAGNLVPDDTNNALCGVSEDLETPFPDEPCLNADVFVHDLVTGRTGRVSVDSDGVEAELGSDNRRPSITAIGRFVAFDSDAAELVEGDGNDEGDVFVRDRTPVLVLTPDPVVFADQVVGTASAPLVVTGVNAGSGPLQITALGITGDATDFAVGADTCTGAVLFAGEICTVEVTFTPSQSGLREALLNVDSTAPGSPHSVTLRGTGTEPLATVTPDPLDFGDVPVFTISGPLIATLQSIGTAPVTVTSVALAGPDAGSFTIVAADDACTGATVAPGDACAVSVSFAPVEVRPHVAELVFTDNATGSPRSVGLVGVGVPSPLAFELTPDPLDLGEVPVGTPSAPGVVTGLSLGDLPVPVGTVTIAGPHAADFAIVAANETCEGALLAPTESCQVPVVFTPSAAGPREAVLEVAVVDGVRTAGLVGVGVGRLLELEPDPVDFGVVVEGETSEALEATATNIGSAPVVITDVVVEQDDEDGEPLAEPEFGIVEGGDACTGVTLAAGEACTIALELEPAAPGTKLGALEVHSDADGTPHVIDLVGLSPHITPDPPLARPGFVTFVTGADFPPEETLVLAWDPGIGTTVVVTDEEGGFRTPMLVLRRDHLGLREITATGPEDAYQVVTDFLAVPGSMQPSDFVNRR